MTDTNAPPTNPGPRWAWVIAWSLQGGALLLATELDFESGVLGFTLTGLLAGAPLVGLYIFLRRLGQRSEGSAPE